MKQEISIEFYNKTSSLKRLWIEPTCIEVKLDSKTEFNLIVWEENYRIEFDEEGIIIYLQYTFELKLFNRPISNELKNPNEWILVEDYS